MADQNNLKSFTIATVFMFICSVALLGFALNYPVLNNQDSVLLGNPVFNDTRSDLSDSLGNYQGTQSERVNLSSADDPQTTAEGVVLGTTTKNARSTRNELTETFGILSNLIGQVFGLNGRQFTFVSGALLSLFSMVLLYYVIKMIRYGY